MKYKLESGNELEMSLADIKTASLLLKAVKNQANFGDLISICLNDEVLNLILKCGEKAFYNGKRVNSINVFENNREDMLEVLVKIMGENINPFSKTPLIEFPHQKD